MCLGRIFHPKEQDLSQSPDASHPPAQTPQGSLLALGRPTIFLGKVLWICALLFSGIRAEGVKYAGGGAGDENHSPNLAYTEEVFDLQLG